MLIKFFTFLPQFFKFLHIPECVGMFIIKKIMILTINIVYQLEYFWISHYYRLRLEQRISNLEMKRRIMNNPFCPFSVLDAVEQEVIHYQMSH